MSKPLYTKHLTTSKLNKIVHLISEFGKYRARPFVMHLYEQGYSSQDIADLIGTTRQSVEQDYPRKESNESL